MLTFLFFTLVLLSLAMGACAFVIALGQRPIPALCGISSAFSANAAAFTLPGHRNLTVAVALVVCAGALWLATGVVLARRARSRGPVRHDPAAYGGTR